MGIGVTDGAGVTVGLIVGATPEQSPAKHTSLSVAGSLSSHADPSALTEHRPVAESQVPPGTRQFESDAEQPTVKQSPIRMSSRAKSPVKLFPEVYLAKG